MKVYSLSTIRTDNKFLEQFSIDPVIGLKKLIEESTLEAQGYVKRNNNSISFAFIRNEFILLHWGDENDVKILQDFIDDANKSNYHTISSTWAAFSNQEKAILMRIDKNLYDVWVPNNPC
jgi:hypothetical protein